MAATLNFIRLFVYRRLIRPLCLNEQIFGASIEISNVKVKFVDETDTLNGFKMAAAKSNGRFYMITPHFYINSQ